MVYPCNVKILPIQKSRVPFVEVTLNYCIMTPCFITRAWLSHSLSQIPYNTLSLVLSLSLSLSLSSQLWLDNIVLTNMVQSRKFRGVRQRHWGSWVSEIRHPLLYSHQTHLTIHFQLFICSTSQKKIRLVPFPFLFF